MIQIENGSQQTDKPQTPFYVRLAHRLRIAFPILLLLLFLTIEVIEEIQGSHTHLGPGPVHEGFYLEAFAFGILSPLLVGLGFHWIAKVVEQLEAARASEQTLRHELERQSQSRRNLLAATVRSQEEERQRVARELHDGIGQPLTAFLLTSEAKDKDDGGDPVLQYARRAASRTLESMRRLILDLRPSLLDQQGLLPALRQCAQDTLAPAGIKIEASTDGQRAPICDEAKTALFRIGQESLTNILRYAEAQKVTIHLKYLPDLVQLSVKDDGVGFDSTRCQSSRSLGLGLLSMQERAEQINGRFQLQTQPGQGTKISVSVPLAPVNGEPT